MAPKKGKRNSTTTGSSSKKALSPKSKSASSPSPKASSSASSSSTPDGSPQTDVTCSICFEDVKKEDLTSIDSCKHLFCFSCIEQWSKHETTCPLCKAKFKQLNRVSLTKDGKTTKRKRGKTEKGVQMSKKVKPKSQHEDIPRSQFLAMLQQFGPPPPSVMRQLTELANRRPPPPGAPPLELLQMLDSVVRGAAGGRGTGIFLSSGRGNPFMDDSDDYDSDYDDEYHEGRYSSLSPPGIPGQPSRSFATNDNDPNAGSADNALEIDDSDDDAIPLQLRPSTLRSGELICLDSDDEQQATVSTLRTTQTTTTNTTTTTTSSTTSSRKRSSIRKKEDGDIVDLDANPGSPKAPEKKRVGGNDSGKNSSTTTTSTTSSSTTAGNR